MALSNLPSDVSIRADKGCIMGTHIYASAYDVRTCVCTGRVDGSKRSPVDKNWLRAPTIQYGGRERTLFTVLNFGKPIPAVFVRGDPGSRYPVIAVPRW